MFQNQSFKKKGAVAQLGERLDGIQKVVGSIPSSSTITKIYLIVLLLFLFSNQNTFANTVNSYKLLIPGETFRNENQKKVRLKITLDQEFHIKVGGKENVIKKLL